MFTGLIEQVAKLEDIKKTSQGAELFFKADYKDVCLGDSIAVNGVCLTIVSFNEGVFCAQAMRETLDKTNLKFLKKGDLINLERAMLANGRLNGHIVQGHVDCTARLQKITQEGFSRRIEFDCVNDLIIKKGSIAINGVSLTVADVLENGFCVCLIPETIEKTNLKNLKVQDIVNIEYDILGKYIKQFIKKQEKKETTITMDYLKENGF